MNMRTPYGIECPYFYGDYFRGKNKEECRLIVSNTKTGQWSVEMCKTCRVPGITRANACENMTLYASVKKGMGKLGRKVTVTAYCSRSKSEVKVPEVGCDLCHKDVAQLTESKE
jgi:hypothetical protein